MVSFETDRGGWKSHQIGFIIDFTRFSCVYIGSTRRSCYFNFIVIRMFSVFLFDFGVTCVTSWKCIKWRIQVQHFFSVSIFVRNLKIIFSFWFIKTRKDIPLLKIFPSPTHLICFARSRFCLYQHANYTWKEDRYFSIHACQGLFFQQNTMIVRITKTSLIHSWVKPLLSGHLVYPGRL